MEILGKGIVTSVAPYLHLGYVAAHSDPVRAGHDLMPVALLVGIGMGLGAIALYLQARRSGEKVRGALLAAVLSLVGFLVAFGILAGPGPPAEQVTAARASSILRMLRTQESTDPPFVSLGDKRLRLPYTLSNDVVRTDAWGHEFLVGSRRENSGREGEASSHYIYWLVSPGPDGKPGTKDDLVFR